MISCTYGCLRNVINLGNSIIGVSILAMPYCFQKCGIILSLLLIVLSGLLVRIACYLLLKGAIMARRRNFECLAFHAMGSSGKLAVEIGVVGGDVIYKIFFIIAFYKKGYRGTPFKLVIGFLIGVCIAFFVVIGDLGPPLASQYFMIENTSNLRAEVLIFLGAFVALPLGLLRKVDSLTSLSFLSIAFYICLILKIFCEASSKLFTKEWLYEVNWWKSEGFLPCLPIFSMALSCQTQLFEFFDTLSEPSVKRMTSVVSGAVFLCSSVYISVGLFGYIACHDKAITGNILVNMTPSLVTEFIKFGFIVTVVISFPLCLFPCRTSLHSLLFKQGLGHHDMAVNFIPDHRFRALTIGLVVITVGISIMLPNIEFVLSIIGSTIGTAICLIFPAVIFIYDTNKNINEKRLAQGVLFVGMFILVACTYTTLREGSESHPQPVITSKPDIVPIPSHVEHFSPALGLIVSPPLNKPDKRNSENGKDNKLLEAPISKGSDVYEVKDQNEKRHEPPEPQAPDVKVEKSDHNADIDPQALQMEDKEIQKESVGNGISSAKEQERLLRQLQEQQKEQKKILEQQKQVLEQLKIHKAIHDEATREENVIVHAKEEKLGPLQENYLNIPAKNNINKAVSGNKKHTEITTTSENIQPDVNQNIYFVSSKKPANSNTSRSKNQFSASININVIPEIGSQNIKPLEIQRKEQIVGKKSNLPQDNIPVNVEPNTGKNTSFSVGKTSNNISKSPEKIMPIKQFNTKQKQNANNPIQKEVQPDQNFQNKDILHSKDIKKSNSVQLILNTHSNNSLNNQLLHSNDGKPEMR